jgi:CO dehydrogenase/acetyl-CoA synthase alpha subunit
MKLTLIICVGGSVLVGIEKAPGDEGCDLITKPPDDFRGQVIVNIIHK